MQSTTAFMMIIAFTAVLIEKCDSVAICRLSCEADDVDCFERCIDYVLGRPILISDEEANARMRKRASSWHAVHHMDVPWGRASSGWWGRRSRKY